MAPKQPLTSGTVVAQAFRVYLDHIATLVTAALFPLAALFLVEMTLAGSGMKPNEQMLSILPLALLVNACLDAMAAFAAQEAREGTEPKAGLLFRRVWLTGFAPLTLGYTLAGMVMMVGFLPMLIPMAMAGANTPPSPLVLVLLPLCMAPGLIVGGMMSLVIPLIALERMPPLQALRVSYQVMRKQAALGMGVFGFGLLAGSMVPMLLVMMAGEGPLSPLLFLLLMGLTAPLACLGKSLLYFNLKERGELSPFIPPISPPTPPSSTPGA
ncbi:MAG: hypothetical protein OEV94_10195 [Deltaproteobacteria bacterium]|nr:hypothetical protein [Deltaproteobacteria bacterium]MDH4122062.1 hypothetical protein [Deltaproteobacteria bacterium]